MNSNRTWGIVAAILAILLLCVGFWGFNANEERNTLSLNNDKLEFEIGDMTALKEELETEIDSLSSAFNSLSEENVSLQEAVKNEKSRVSRRNVKIKGLKNEMEASMQSNANEMASLRNQIQDLISAKMSLTQNIVALTTENDSLRSVSGILASDLRIAKDENVALVNLNTSIQSEVGKLTLANFKASAFRVEVGKKKATKVTSKGKRAKNIMVSFDLTNVPEQYQGVRPIYLVITDDKATPVKLENPIKATVKVNGQMQDILAAEAKDINIAGNQRLSFNHELAEKLGSGFYRIAAYTDIGLLGASSFRLN